jgi:hypothetical protein
MFTIIQSLVSYTPNELFTIFTGVVVSNVFIVLFYKTFKLKWPDLYFSVNNMDAFFISVSFQRYLFFRFFPCFLINTLVITVITKTYPLHIAYTAGAFSLFIHGFLTNGIAIYRIIKKSKRIKIYFNYSFQLFLHLITMILLTLLGIASGFASRQAIFIALTPSPQGLVDNIWSALITVILVEYLRLIYTEKSIKLDEVFNKSLKSISPDILNLIDKYCISNNANAVLAKAICIVENIQRPKWIRMIENIKAILGLHGTYGIMQVKTNKFISDEESVRLAIATHLQESNIVRTTDMLRYYINKYNSSEEYKDLVIRAMYFIDPNSADYPG